MRSQEPQPRAAAIEGYGLPLDPQSDVYESLRQEIRVTGYDRLGLVVAAGNDDRASLATIAQSHVWITSHVLLGLKVRRRGGSQYGTYSTGVLERRRFPGDVGGVL